jgi:hypothetical protein
MRVCTRWATTWAVVIVWFMSIADAAISWAQPSDRRFTQELTEGTTYVVAFPQLWTAPSEKPTSAPMQIVITSRFKARVVLTSPGQPDLPAFERAVDVEPGHATRVAVPTGYMSTKAGERVNNAITVRATAPVTVYTTMAWNGGGELARHLPTTAWGKEYRTFNLYQDRYGTSGSGYKYRPGQILIIAQQDNTTVTYTPTVDTEAGAHAASVAKGNTATIVLQQGQTFLIKAAINDALTKEWTSDLSGTRIRSDRPIAVVSGHTKGAIMRVPDLLPPVGMFAAEAHFVRNGIHEALLPTSMAGTEFVTVPLMYTAARTTGYASPQYGMDDDRGDVIRIVALEDNTALRRVRQDGAGEVNVRTLQRGEVHIETAHTFATRWTTSRPALMMQYGKSFAKVPPPPVIEGGDATQGFPTIEAGMPCMLNVPSVDRWTSHASFDVPEGIDNFLNVVCKIGDAAKIKINGSTNLLDVIGGVRPINGTEYGYARIAIIAGTHTVASTAPGVVFGAWSYGSHDGLMQGRSYGSAITVRLNTNCEDDSVFINDVVDTTTGLVAGTAAVDGDQNCANTVDVALVSSTNYVIGLPQAPMLDRRELPFTLTVVDPASDAVAVVHAMSPSGKVLERMYTYKGATTSVDDVGLAHGLVVTPNPVNDVLQVQGIGAAARVQVVTMAGAAIDMPVSDRLDVSALPPGPYMLKVVEGGKVMTARFMVVR